MRRTILTLLLSSLGLMASLAQSQLGMNYQAVIRNAEGKIIANTKVGIQISILKESTTGEPVYTETFTPTTNEFGLINLVISKGQVVSGDYSSIDWSVADYFLKIELDAEGGTAYQEMGTSQLLSVPYANYAFNSASSWKDTEGNISTKNKVEIASDGKNLEAPLFEVKNAKGEIIFAVFENGVEIYLDEETGGRKTRGGFAISGRTTTKETKELINVTPNETTIYVDEPTAKTRGGFAISGRTTTKAGGEILLITPSLTQFYVDEATAKTRGGFAISGRTTTKALVDLLNITPSLTQFYVDEAAAKTRGGFAISGRTTTKAPVDLLNITPSLTQFYVAEPSTKTRGGFAISGRTTTKEGEADILTVTPKLTQVFVEETTTKTRGGFAISGRTTTKESGLYDVFTVVPERTDVYLKPSNSKNSLPIGFGVHGLNENNPLESTEFFSISDAGTYVATPLAVKPIVKTGIITNLAQTSAMAAGTVLNIGGADVTLTASGIVYHNAAALPTLESVSGLTPENGGMVSAFNSEIFNIELAKLSPGVTYKARAFATNSNGLTGYGETVDFTTPAGYEVIVDVKAAGDPQTPLTSTVTFWNSNTQETESSENKATHTFTLPDGDYNYKVEADGYNSESRSYFYVSKDITEVVVLNPAQGNAVQFSVTDQYGQPVDSVYINIVSVGSDITNLAGNATFYLPASEYSYSVSAPQGYDHILTPDLIYVVDGTNPLVEITLNKQHKVTFNIKSHDGSPHESGRIILEKLGQTTVDHMFYYSENIEIFLPADQTVEGEWTYTVEDQGGQYLTDGTITVTPADVVTNVIIPAPPTHYTVNFHVHNVGMSGPLADPVDLKFSNPGIFEGVKPTVNEYATFYNVPASDIPYLLNYYPFELSPGTREIPINEYSEGDQGNDVIITTDRKLGTMEIEVLLNY